MGSVQACCHLPLHAGFQRRDIWPAVKTALESVAKAKKMQPVGDTRPQNTLDHHLR